VRRPNFFQYPVPLFLIIAAFALLPASAAAVVASTTATGRVSYLPMEGAGSTLRGTAGLTVPSGSPPLEWHGGPVMPSHEAFAIFWAPSGYPFPSGYTAGITKYLENVAADSGLSTNVYSVSAQYEGSNGHASYEDSFGGSVADTHAYPTTGTCPAYEGFNGAEYTACLSDAKIEAEVQAVRVEQGWPSGLEAEYYVVLPPHVGSCFGSSAESSCFDEEFCAYHSYSSSPATAIYANISYSPEDPTGCGVGEYPNGTSNGKIDDTLSSLSHEANESITDPLLNAYYDKKGFENGDECRNSSDDYGPALGGSTGTLFNQSINGAHYYLQQEWSNDINNCAQRVAPATPVIADPGPVAPEELVPFDGSASKAGAGGISSYEWEFGDGGTGSGAEATHSYAEVGTYTVTLTLTDDGGFTYSTSRQVEVAPPPEGAEEEGGGGEEEGGGKEEGGGEEKPGPTPPPAPSPIPAPSPTPRPVTPGVAVAAAKAKVKNGVALVKLTCKGGGACSGVVKLLDRGVIGHARFSIAAGKTVTLHVKLTRSGIALLSSKSGGALKVSLSGAGVRHRSVSLAPAS
jgi:hypothetical protein